MLVKAYLGRVKAYDLSTEEFIGEYKSIPREAEIIALLQQDDVEVYADCSSRQISFKFDFDDGRSCVIKTGMKVPTEVFELEGFELEFFCHKAARAALKLGGFREYLG